MFNEVAEAARLCVLHCPQRSGGHPNRVFNICPDGRSLDIPIEVPATAGKHAVMDITMSFPEDGQLAGDPMDFPLEACLKSYWMPQHRF